MQPTRINLGYVPLRRGVFSAQAAAEERAKALAAFQAWDICDITDIGSINQEGLLFDECDLPNTIAILQKANVDGLLLANNNFGCEHLAAKVAKAIGKPVLLWGPRDEAPAPDGTRTRDSQCGLFATGKVLRRFNVPFSYVVNSRLEDAVFQNGLRDFIAVCGVVKAFRNIRILQVSTRPDEFWTMMCNEGELLEKFNVQVYPVTFVDIQTGVDVLLKDPSNPQLTQAVQQLEDSLQCEGIEKQAILNLAALKVTLRQLADKFNCNAIAIQCWFSMQKLLGIMPCVANGLLTDEGIPTVCETDIHGAISSIMLQATVLNTRPIFFADMTIRHPANDNAELLWHCGNFPPSLAKDAAGRTLDCSFIVDAKCPGIGVWEIKGGDITVCRFDGDHGEYRLFIGEGQSTDGPANKGTYLWLEVGNWPLWEHKLVTGPYVHHCAGVHGKVGHILLEACKYIPGLMPDPAEPSHSELERRLMGL